MTNVNEIWRPVKGYEGYYEVSNYGRIKSSYRQCRILKPCVTQKGYLEVNLFINKVPSHKKIHRLVAEAFIEKIIDNEMVNHKDGNKLNNIYSNLEWCNASKNNLHAYSIGLKNAKGYKNGRAKLSDQDIVAIRKSNSNYKELAIQYGIHCNYVHMIKRFANWNHLTQL